MFNGNFNSGLHGYCNNVHIILSKNTMDYLQKTIRTMNSLNEFYFQLFANQYL